MSVTKSVTKTVTVDALIIGAGPAGLAMSACLFKKKIEYIVIEKSDCIAPLWQRWAYDSLELQLPKQYCELPYLHFPENCPEYPRKQDFVTYLNEYANEFNIEPNFNECVTGAEYDEQAKRWTVESEKKDGDSVLKTKYICIVLVVATGRNAEPVIPDDIIGLDDFLGEKFHSSEYKNDENYKGKTVLVIGSGNSAIDILLELTSREAKPFVVLRNNLIEKFREKIKAYELAKMMMNFGDFMGDSRGQIEINVLPKIKNFTSDSVELENGETRKIDCVVMATGYRCNVNDWLKGSPFFDENGVPNEGIELRDMAAARLYVIGFKTEGIQAIYYDAVPISDEIER